MHSVVISSNTVSYSLRIEDEYSLYLFCIGTCVCFTNFAGADCSVDVNAAPTALSLDNSHCISKDASDCTLATVRGDDFVETAQCHLREVKVRTYLEWVEGGGRWGRVGD